MLGAKAVVQCGRLRGFSYLCFRLHGWGRLRRSILFMRWRHEAWVVGRDAREPDRGRLGQRRAAVPVAVVMVEEVVWGRGGRGGRRMRVRAAGSSGVTTVNAVQTTVKGGGWEMRRWPKEGDWQRQAGWRKSKTGQDTDRRRMDNMKGEDWGSVGEKGWETINTAHQDAASIN